MKTPLRTLIIEDDPNDTQLLVDVLETGGYDVTWTRVETATELIASLEHGPWDVVLCDLSLPRFDGDQALRLTAASLPDVPVIVVTGTIGEERLADTMRSGARDFVLKDRLERLGPAVRREINAARARVQRRLLEERLRREQERFRALVEKSPEPITVTDRNGTVMYASPSAQDLFGYEPYEYAGHTVFEFLHPGDVAPAQRHLAQLALAPNGGFKEEVRCVKKDGTRRWVEVSVSNLLDDPDVGGLVFAYHDVTERKTVEEQRERERRRAEALLDLLQNRGRTTEDILQFMIEQAVQMTGSNLGLVAFVAPDETLVSPHWAGTAVDSAKPPLKDALWLEAIRQRRSVVVNGGAALSVRSPQRAAVHRSLAIPVVREGRVVMLCAFADKEEPYDDADLLHVRLFTEGVWGLIQSERQQVALQRNEKHFRALTEQSLDVVTVIEPDGRITYHSQSARRVLGWDAADVVGKKLYDFMHPDDRGKAEHWLTQLAPGAVAAAEFRARHRDGTYRVMDTIARNLALDPDIAGIVINARDVTDRKLLEQQYLHSQKLEAFGQLAGGVAHDFNNILAVMLMNFSLLQLEPDVGPPLANWLRDLENLTYRAAALTRQLLIFARRKEMSMQPLDLNRTTENICGMLQRLIGENIAFEFRRAPAPLWIVGDGGMIEQVATNLCVNARDAMPTGGRLTVALSVEPRSGNEVERTAPDDASAPSAAPTAMACITVSDTGCGMDEATRRRIFEPFFTTKPAGQGTGLGLATVYGIVKQHRGTIEVESTPGAGSTFRVYLPITNQPADAEPVPPAAAATAAGREAVLLVEDEELVRKSFCLCLQRAGYRVTEAENAAEAAKAWAEQRGAFDLLVTDMVMPGASSGAQLAKRLIQDKPSLRVLIISGYAVAAASASPFATQVVHLTKPFSPDTLLRTVREVLDAK